MRGRPTAAKWARENLHEPQGLECGKKVETVVEKEIRTEPQGTEGGRLPASIRLG